MTSKKKVTICFRTGGIIVSETCNSNEAINIGRRMISKGFMICEDDCWEDGKREVIVNLADVSCVILEENDN